MKNNVDIFTLFTSKQPSTMKIKGKNNRSFTGVL